MKRVVILSVALLLSSLAAKAQNKTYPELLPDTSAFADQLQALDYESVIAIVNKEIETQKRRRKPATPQQEEVLARSNRIRENLKGTDRVLIIDSVVVGKAEFLTRYGFSHEIGTIRTNDHARTTEYETERGNRLYRVQPASEKHPYLSLVSIDKEGGKLLMPRPLNGLEMDCDVNYPFMMPDGVTFYFAARTDDGYGNYDLYVTRYDNENDRFYRPDNMGYPYNSYANDYMMVIDESNNLGWFASDRYQPAGKVCIYTFVPNVSRHTIDFENTDPLLLRQQASLRPIRSTWNEENQQARIATRQRIVMQTAAVVEEKEHDFDLVINDNYTYTSLNDFHSPEARKLCEEWMTQNAQLNKLQTELNQQRNRYASASKEKRRDMQQDILDLEQRTNSLRSELAQKVKRIRNQEQSK